MANAGLFFRWGPPVRGREAKGLEVFTEVLSFCAGQQDSGAIESYEVVIIGPHGGDLYGFILARGSEEQVADLRASEETQRLMTRAGLVVEQFGVLNAAVGEGVGEAVSVFQEAVGELA